MGKLLSLSPVWIALERLVRALGLSFSTLLRYVKPLSNSSRALELYSMLFSITTRVRTARRAPRGSTVITGKVEIVPDDELPEKSNHAFEMVAGVMHVYETTPPASARNPRTSGGGGAAHSSTLHQLYTTIFYGMSWLGLGFKGHWFGFTGQNSHKTGILLS